MRKLLHIWTSVSLVKRIAGGLILGIILGIFLPQATLLKIFGTLFVEALKSVAPLLVLLLVMSALAKQQEGQKTNIKGIVFLYLMGTFLSACVAVTASFLFPVTLTLNADSASDMAAPGGVGEVLTSLVMKLVSNPIAALEDANYIGILAWAVLLGIALRKASEGTKQALSHLAEAVSMIVRWVINLAPFGVMGLVFTTISEQGLTSLLSYGKLLLVLVGSMAAVAFIMNPIITFLYIRRNPFPLVFKCLKDSGITAFFTRSSAANIPVNLRLCEDLGLDRDTYAVSIPLGATINMGGAAVTITVLALAAANTLGIHVDIITAVILSVLSAVSACGASGVAGGSLLLVPLACSLFGIPDDVALQVVGTGFIVGVIQDSCETALNSSTDVLYTAVVELKKKGN